MRIATEINVERRGRGIPKIVGYTII